MAKTKITAAPEAQQIGTELIPQHHQALQDAQVLYAFTNQKRTRQGRRVLGTAQKLSPKDCFLLRAFMESFVGEHEDDTPTFLILLDAEVWPILKPEQQIALVDHELCHCVITEDKDGNPEAALRRHDVEEFREVIESHGLWYPELELLSETLEQLKLAL